MADKVESDAKTRGIRVFVYGTLKKGRGNWGCLSNDDFLGRCFIEGPYKMLTLGWFPGVVEVPRVTPESPAFVNRIVGEVYRVSHETLEHMDQIEGNGTFYTRRKIETPWKKAWVYMLPSDYQAKYPENSDKHIWKPTAEELAWFRGLEPRSEASQQSGF